MTRNKTLWMLLGVWVLLVILSIWIPLTTAPTDTGLTRGLNRVTLFFQFQFAALVVALILWIFSRRLDPAWKRWLARVPSLLALALFSIMAGLIVWSNLQRLPLIAPQNPGPPTAPVTGN